MKILPNAPNKHEQFFVAELLRFWEGQQSAGKSWLRDTLNLWRKQAGRGYAVVVKKIEADERWRGL